jgi:hypothetical protein
MKPPVKKRVGKKRQLSRTELARRIITDYADQLPRDHQETSPSPPEEPTLF